WEELQSDRLFHEALLDLISRFLREGSVAPGVFSRYVATSLGTIFAAEEVCYLGRSDEGGFAVLVAVGEGRREGEKCTLSGRNLMANGVFVTGLRWEGNVLSFSLEPGLPSFLVVPLLVSEKLEGLFLIGGKKRAFTGADVQRAQIVKEILELLFFRRKTEEELLYLSSHDSLTGALNHKAFRERGGEVLALAERYQRPLSLIFLDVDDFKAINDSFGHLFGDRVLSCFAQYLRTNLRRSDLLARLGGDEFVLLLPETPGEKARELLERLESNPLFLEEGEEIVALHFSAGVSIYPEDGRTLEALMEVADLRMYEGKKARRRKHGNVERSDL
ncbi:MAG: GGDEF domain-containing protein, partial [Candidatus Caldatribacteriaceae bacterium]